MFLALESGTRHTRAIETGQLAVTALMREDRILADPGPYRTNHFTQPVFVEPLRRQAATVGGVYPHQPDLARHHEEGEHRVEVLWQGTNRPVASEECAPPRLTPSLRAALAKGIPEEDRQVVGAPAIPHA